MPNKFLVHSPRPQTPIAVIFHLRVEISRRSIYNERSQKNDYCRSGAARRNTWKWRSSRSRTARSLLAVQPSRYKLETRTDWWGVDTRNRFRPGNSYFPSRVLSRAPAVSFSNYSARLISVSTCIPSSRGSLCCVGERIWIFRFADVRGADAMSIWWR